MKIVDLECLLVEVPRATARTGVRRLLVRIVGTDGAEGWGEGPALWRSDEIEPRRQLLVRALAGRNVFETADLAELDMLRAPALRSAVEMALWDLIGRAAGQPLCHLWGGMYRHRAPCAVRLFADSLEHLVLRAREASHTGYRAFVLEATSSDDESLQRAAAVAEQVHDAATLRLDVAGRFDPAEASRLCGSLAAARLQAVCDPLPAAALETMASLGAASKTVLSVRRTVTSPARAMAIVRTGGVGMFEIELSAVGGLVAARECGAVAGAAGISAAVVAGECLGIATAAALQLCASIPAFNQALETSCNELLDNIVVEPLHTSDGMLAIPNGPGLGIEVNRSAVERYLVG